MIETSIKRPESRLHTGLPHWFTPAAISAFGVLLITVIALFTKPYIGMADNGDYFRVAYSNGLYFLGPDYDSHYFDHFIKHYGILQYYNENGTTMMSSQSLFIRIAMTVNQLLYSGEVFDIRFQGAIFTVLYVAAVYLLVEAITWKLTRRQGLIVAALAVFIFGDTGYTAYFNSFYSESIVLIMMMLVFASWLLIYRRRYNDYVMLAVFAVSGILLTTSKQQNAPVGIVLAVLGAALLFARRDKPFRVLTAGALALLAAAGIATYVLIPKEFVNINQYHAMTRGVLKESSDPEAALKSFGIDKQYAILRETIYYEQYGPVDVDSRILEEDFYSKYGFGSILRYYVTHPDQLTSILNVAAKDAFSIRPNAMGNYEPTAGKPDGAHTGFFTLYSLLKRTLAPKTFGFIVLWAVVILGLHAPSFLQAVKARNARDMQRMALLLAAILIGLSGIFVSIIGAGDADLAKHEFLFTLAFDLVSFMTAGQLIGRTVSFRMKAKPAPQVFKTPEVAESQKGMSA